MTDLTILIAVIALALWPIVFLISRILHERNKRAKPSGDTASAETEEVTEEMTTSALIMSILQQLGCQPEVNEENHISFKYQGDDFLVAAEDGLRLIIVWNPWWASISIDNQALPYLKEIIEMLGLTDKLTNLPNTLSGGQQQRVAIARALATKPAIILADEPTGNLDSKTSDEVMTLLKTSAFKYEQTLIVITHNEDIAQMGKRNLIITDGKVVEE